MEASGSALRTVWNATFPADSSATITSPARNTGILCSTCANLAEVKACRLSVYRQFVETPRCSYYRQHR